LVAVLAIAALSCDVGYLLPSGATFPTPAPGEIETVIAGTAQAAQTQTAELQPPSATPSPTPTVTRTATSTPTITPTFIFFLRTPVPPRTATPTGGSSSSGSGGYACRLVSQTPTDGTEFKPNASFDMVWRLENTGSRTWQADNVDFTYVSGRKMHDEELYDLPRNVPVGEIVNMTVDMQAPKVSGDWKTVWTLRVGSNDFCHVDVTIVVK
jgi:hypothetical protein